MANGFVPIRTAYFLTDTKNCYLAYGTGVGGGGSVGHGCASILVAAEERLGHKFGGPEGTVLPIGTAIERVKFAGEVPTT
ncbi:hypothetical protein ABW20_dc0108186 [Dactylellina cionopaga]|nr:hypothetical protein ABW20_dc0108186 [Dactylellina cionopaga]